MLRIRNVICPLDFSDLSVHELDLAVEVCRAFGSVLVLHHNLVEAVPGVSKSWEWQEEHQRTCGSIPDVEVRLRRLMREIDPSIRTEARISTGPLLHALLALADELSADLMVLGSHGWSTTDHASVCERLLARASCPLLCFEAGQQTAVPFRLRPAAEESACRVLVAADLSEEAAVLQYAFDLARALPVRLHLLEVVPGGAREAERACRDLGARVPFELRERVECHGRTGHVVDGILRCAEALQPTFLIMGEHARGLIRGSLTRDTAREVLRRVGRPVWFVPRSYHPPAAG